jgi:hypothetical protein
MSDKHKIVKVEWVDSASSSGWRKPEECGFTKVESIGFEVSRTDEAICITTSIDDQGAVIDALSIPMCAVKSVEEVNAQAAGSHWPNFELWWDQNGDMVSNSVLAMAFKEMCKECARQGWRGAQGPV